MPRLTRNKRFSLTLLAALCLAVVCSFYMTQSRAEDNPAVYWTNANIAWYTASPDATEFTISTSADLAGLAKLVGTNSCDFNNKTILLSNDVDLGSIEWAPIGGSNNNKHFRGTFDGQGRSVTGLKITSGDCSGLFGYISDSARIMNLTVGGSVAGTNYVGGVVGCAYGGSITNCVNMAGITATANDSTYNGAGGIVGYCAYSYSGNVTNCVNMASVTATGDNPKAGGVVGYAGSETTTIAYSTNLGNVTADKAGGVVGYLRGTISDCFSSGVVSGNYAGGAVGELYYTTTTIPGGYGENATYGTIANCGWFANGDTNLSLKAAGLTTAPSSYYASAASTDNYTNVVTSYTVNPDNTTITPGADAVVLRTWPGASAANVQSVTTRADTGVTAAADENKNVRVTAGRAEGVYSVSASVSFTPTDFTNSVGLACSADIATLINVKNIPATGITITPNTAQTISVGGTASFTATLAPTKSNSAVAWTVSGGAVTIAPNGKACAATGAKAGTATVTATANGHAASCDVTVSAAQPTGSSGGGCAAGFGALALLATVPMLRRRKK